MGQQLLDLQSIREGKMTYDELAQKHEEILGLIDQSVLDQTSRDSAAIVQLDLVFMMGAYLPDGNFEKCPASLIELAKLIAETHGLASYMDYELVIDVNSAEFERTGRMRTFLGGDDYRAERDFYYGHHLSEKFIKNVAVELRSIVDASDAAGTHNASLVSAAESMREFKEHMAKYARLSKDVFGLMRPYLASYPDGTRNASGAFMPSVQLAELMLHHPTAEHLSYIKESLPYFPSWARDYVRNWASDSADGKNLADLIETGSVELNNEDRVIFNRLIEDFYRFRTTHLGITKKQIPEAFGDRNVPASRKQFSEFGEPDILADGVPGTAGFDIVNILGGSTYRIVNLQSRIEDATKVLGVE